MKNPRLPNFLVLGPPRTGTTWLYHCMRKHPQIFLPKIKQLHFFDRNFHKGVGWYKRFFADAGEEKILLGEITPDYLSDEIACQRIKKTCGNIKAIIVYRDPVERAFSGYKIRLRSGKYANHTPFSEALKNDSKLVRDSLYGNNLERCIRLFGNHNIYIASYVKMKQAPHNFIDGILNFLSAMNDFHIDHTILRSRYGESLPMVKFRNLNGCMIRIRKSFERTMGGRKLTSWLRDIGIVKKIQNYNSIDNPIPLSSSDYRSGHMLFSKDMAAFIKNSHECGYNLVSEMRKGGAWNF